MGRLKNTILGDVTGKVGNIVFRVKGKKAYAYSSPQKVKVSQKKEAKEARNKFTPLSRFASYINSIPDLKYFWTQANIEASSAYHKISKLNYKYLLHNRPTIENVITPRWYNTCGNHPVRNSFLDRSGIRIEAKYEKGSFIPFEEEEFISAMAIICFYNPIKRWGKYFILDQMVKDNIEVEFVDPFEFKIPFTDTSLSNYYSYRNSILYLTLITRDINGNPLRFSQNYTHEFVHEYSEEEKKTINIIQGKRIREKIKVEYRGYMKRIASMWRKG
jgi:hypothetical protein